MITLETLAEAIFHRPLSELNELQQRFVWLQMCEWRRYRRTVERSYAAVRALPHNKSRENAMIAQYFLQRCPPWVLERAIRRGIALAERYGKTIFSFGFFRPHVTALQRQEPPPRVAEIHRDPAGWYYSLFAAVTARQENGERVFFDPWQGEITAARS